MRLLSSTPRRSRAALGALALLAALALTGCGGGDDPAPAATTVAPAGVTEASATIGAAGGTIDGPDGVQLVVPAGALAQDTTIRIARSSTGAPALPEGWTAAGPLVEITPHGLHFARPVTVRVPATAPAGAVLTDMLVAEPGDTQWSRQQSTLNNGYVETTRMSLSWYMGGACAPRNLSDPYPCIVPVSNSTLDTVPAGGATLTWSSRLWSTWTVNQAGTLRINVFYSAAPDCQNPRLRIRRSAYAIGAPVTTLYETTNLGFAPLPNFAPRIGGRVTFDLPITAADNGEFLIGSYFACNRPGEATYEDGYVHVVTANVPPPAAAPTIAQPPADLTVTAGQPAAFAVGASAPDTLSIVWQQSLDGGATFTDLAATGPALAIAATTSADNGKRFRAHVCNAATGKATTCLDSASALLTVNAPSLTWSAPDTLTTGLFTEAAAGLDGAGHSLAVWGITGNINTRLVASAGSVGGAWAAPTVIDAAVGGSSFEPQLGMTSTGAATAVWGYAVGNRYGIAANRFGGTGWGAAEVLDDGASGTTFDQRVAVDGSNRAVAAWTKYNGARYVISVRLSRGGWEPVVTLDRGVEGTQPQVAVNAQGRGFVSYIERGAIVAAAVDLAAGTVGTPFTVATGRSMADQRLAVDAGGGAVIAWIEDMPVGYDLRAARFAAGQWAAPETVAANVLFNRDLAAAAGAAGEAVVTWVGRDTNGQDAVFARRLLPGSGWEAASRRSGLNARSVRAVQAAMNASGRIVISWTQRDATDVITQTWAQAYDGGWASAQPVSSPTTSTAVPSRPIVTRSLAVGDDGRALLLWSDSGGTTAFGAYLR